MEIAFKTTTCGKVSFQLPCGIERVSHGEAFAWFESTWNFVVGSAYNGKKLASYDNDRVLLQHQETKCD